MEIKTLKKMRNISLTLFFLFLGIFWWGGNESISLIFFIFGNLFGVLGIFFGIIIGEREEKETEEEQKEGDEDGRKVQP